MTTDVQLRYHALVIWNVDVRTIGTSQRPIVILVDVCQFVTVPWSAQRVDLDVPAPPALVTIESAGLRGSFRDGFRLGLTSKESH
jgi:hypothetical protein